MGSSVVVGCFGCLTDLASFDLDEKHRFFVDGEEKKGPFEWTCSRCGAEYRQKAIELRQRLVALASGMLIDHGDPLAQHPHRAVVLRR